MKIKTCFFQKLLGDFQPRYKEIEIHKQDAGHMTNMAEMPIYNINTYKIFFLGTSGPISIKDGMTH